MIARIEKRLMVQYLLGELLADERDRLESAYLNNNDVFQELVECENDLVDSYILGELSGSERMAFERSYLADSARQEIVETARSLLAYSTAAENAMLTQKAGAKHTEWGGPWLARIAVAALFLIMIGAMSWLLLVNRRLGNALGELERKQQSGAAEQQRLQQQIDSLQATLQQRDDAFQEMQQSPLPGVVTFTLGSGVPRGNGDEPSLVLPAGAEHIFLHILMNGNPHARYGLSLRTADGSLVLARSGLQPEPVGSSNQRISVKLSARLLLNASYVVRVYTGTEDPVHTLVGYSFNVIRRSH